MELAQALRRFYYEMTLTELRLMNENQLYPDISYNSLLYLDLISDMERCTVSALAEALHVTKAAVTMRVNELIRRGLVVKTQSETDRRVNYLSLTPAMAEDHRLYDRRLTRAAEGLAGLYPPGQLAAMTAMLADFSRLYRAEDDPAEAFANKKTESKETQETP